VRVSNQALERFKLAQVAHTQEELKPALEHALTLAPEPDASFAKRPSTAALILANTRRALPLPTWRVRTVRAATALITAVGIAGVTFTSSLAYWVVDAFAKPTTTSVTTPKDQVAILVDASPSQVPELARAAFNDHVQVSFALESVTTEAVVNARFYGDHLVARLSDSGLVGWFHTEAKLHRLERELGLGRHFVYASNGSSLAQYILAHSAGGRLVAGAVRISHVNQIPSKLKLGEVVEIRPSTIKSQLAQLSALSEQLHDQGLNGVPITTLFKDAGQSV
jgi:hypothetical protein